MMNPQMTDKRVLELANRVYKEAKRAENETELAIIDEMIEGTATFSTQTKRELHNVVENYRRRLATTYVMVEGSKLYSKGSPAALAAKAMGGKVKVHLIDDADRA